MFKLYIVICVVILQSSRLAFAEDSFDHMSFRSDELELLLEKQLEKSTCSFSSERDLFSASLATDSKDGSPETIRLASCDSSKGDPKAAGRVLCQGIVKCSTPGAGPIFISSKCWGSGNFTSGPQGGHQCPDARTCVQMTILNRVSTEKGKNGGYRIDQVPTPGKAKASQ